MSDNSDFDYEEYRRQADVFLSDFFQQVDNVFVTAFSMSGLL